MGRASQPCSPQRRCSIAQRLLGIAIFAHGLRCLLSLLLPHVEGGISAVSDFVWGEM